MKKWIDDTSDAFGGLELCSIEAVVGKDGKEYIIEVCGSSLTLLGDSQEEDRRGIAELIIQRMNAICKTALIKQQSRASISSHSEFEPADQRPRASITSLQSGAPVGNPPPGPPSAMPPPLPSNPPPVPPHPSLNRRSSKEVTDSTAQSLPYNENNPFVTAEPAATTNVHTESQISDKSKPPLSKRDSQSAIDDIKDEVDDTMRNLRKTFAGIFGDM